MVGSHIMKVGKPKIFRMSIFGLSPTSGRLYKEGRADVLCQRAGRILSYLGEVGVCFTSSTDWVRPTHSPESNLLCLVFPFKYWSHPKTPSQKYPGKWLTRILDGPKLPMTFEVDVDASWADLCLGFCIISDITKVLRVDGEGRKQFLLMLQFHHWLPWKRESWATYIFITHALSFFVELVATESLLKNENAAADTRTAAGLYHIVSGKGVAEKLPSLLSVNPSARLVPSSSGTRPLTCHSHLPPAPRVWWPGGFMHLTCRGTTGRSGPMESMSALSQLLGSGWISASQGAACLGRRGTPPLVIFWVSPWV